MPDGRYVRLALAALSVEAGPPLEDAELEEYRRQFEAVLEDARALVAACGVGRLAWSPSPKKWSVADCLNHLNVTTTKYLPRIEAMIAQGRAEGLTRHGPFRHPFVGNWFIRMLEPPPRRRMRVPGVFAPLPGVEPRTLLPAFERLRAEILRRIQEADGLDLSALSTPSPAARFFTLTLGQCFGALAAHDRRHLWQGREVLAHPDFPGAVRPG